MPLSADADDALCRVIYRCHDANSAAASETTLGRLVKQSLNSAVEKVGEAVKKALEKAVEEQVQNAIGRATQHDAENLIVTIKTQEPSEGPTVIDLTEDQSDEIKVQEDSSTILDDPIQPGRTYLIYSKICCWHIITINARLEVGPTRGSQACVEEFAFINPFSHFQWKCIKRNGNFCFYNEATRSFLRVEYIPGQACYLAATHSKKDRTMFRLERGPADGTYTLHYLAYGDTWQGMEKDGNDKTQCCVNECVRADGCETVYIWRFREVWEE